MRPPCKDDKERARIHQAAALTERYRCAEKEVCLGRVAIILVIDGIATADRGQLL